MKKGYILVLLLIIILMTGCSRISSNTQRNVINISSKIIKYIHSGELNEDGLTRKEKKILTNFIDSYADFEVNLDEVKSSDLDEYSTIKDVSNYIYEKDGNHFIKYSDIEWIDGDDMGYFTPTIDGKTVKINREYVPIIGDETVGSSYYTFMYDHIYTQKNKIDVYYKGMSMGNGLIIRYYIKNNKIKNIYLIFDNVYKQEEQVKKASSFSKILIILAIIVIVAGLVYLILSILKRSRI